MMMQWFKVIQSDAASRSVTYELHDSIAYDSQTDFMEAMVEQIIEREDEMYRGCSGYRGTQVEPVAPHEVPLKELRYALLNADRYFERIQRELTTREAVIKYHKDNIHLAERMNEETE